MVETMQSILRLQVEICRHHIWRFQQIGPLHWGESTLQLWILMPSLYGLHLTRCGDDFWGPFPCSFRNPNELWASPVKTCMVLPHSRVCPPGCLWITDLIKLVLSPCLFSPRISLSCSHPPLSVTVQSPGASVWDLPSSSVRRGEG